jgi:hypothetical protein
VCWLCGGTPCDWLEYSAELLKEINNKFPTDIDGNRIDASSHEIVSMNQIRYALFPNCDGQEYTGFLPANEPVNL